CGSIANAMFIRLVHENLTREGCDIMAPALFRAAGPAAWRCDGAPPRLVAVGDTLSCNNRLGCKSAAVSVQVSSNVCSASFGTISHLVPTVRQSCHDAPRLSIVHAFGEPSHFLCAASPMSQIIYISSRHRPDSALEDR